MTIDRIARLAGVSKSTVSRVMNGRPGPSLKTAKLVNAVIRREGYVAAPIGRRPGLRRSLGGALRYGQVAVIAVDNGYHRHPELFVRLLAGIGQALADQGLSLLLVQAEHPNQLPHVVRNGAIDGMLLAGHTPESDLLQALPKVPAVWMTSRSDNRGDQVMLGNEAAGTLAAQYLAEQVDGPIACLNPSTRNVALSRRCHAFLVTAMELRRPAQCFAPQPGEMPPADRGEVRDVQAVLRPLLHRLADAPQKYRGLFIADDRTTAAAYPLLHEMGLTPGSRLAVVSCDHEKTYLAGLCPEPPSIDLAQEIVGQRAVEQLLRRIAEPEKHRPVQLALVPELVLPGPGTPFPGGRLPHNGAAKSATPAPDFVQNYT